MKKNAMMRIASVLLVAVLLTTCSISGTFAKYVSKASGEDSARVAYWGWGVDSTLTIDGLFAETYAMYGSADPHGNDDISVDSVEGDVLAPGTYGEAEFSFRYTENDTELASPITAPEVDYHFDVTVVAACDQLIQDNMNIQWKLDNGVWGTWADLINALDDLGEGAADGVYEAGQLPDGFGVGESHTISWQWIFENDTNTYDISAGTSASPTILTQDQYDTYMGNQADLDDVSIEITITATQID